MVDDDDGDESPSPEPRTDSRSALPGENRAWWWLDIVKHDETFSLIFFLPKREYMELELRSVEVQGAHETVGHAQGEGARPHPRGQGVGPLVLILSPVFFIFSKKCLHGFLGHSENFCFLHIKQHHGSSAENSVSPG